MNNIEKLAIERGITITHNGYAGETDLLNIETAEAFAKALQSSEPVAYLSNTLHLAYMADEILEENKQRYTPLFTHPPASVPLDKYNKLLDAANGVIAYVDSQKAMCEHLSVTALRKAIAEAEGKEGKEG